MLKTEAFCKSDLNLKIRIFQFEILLINKWMKERLERYICEES